MTRDEIEKIINDSEADVKVFLEKIKFLYNKDIETKTILGVDVYKYSEMNVEKQYLLPYVIDKLFNQTIESIKKNENKFFLIGDIENYVKTKIDTGDGFYIFFDNPFQALVFLMALNINITLLQTRNMGSTLMKICDDFIFRFAITTGDIYQFENKYFGEAIIKCARVLALDRENRFLMDKESYYWFYNNANGMETLTVETLVDICLYQNIYYDQSGLSLLFDDKNPTMKTIITQKIGQIKSKEKIVDIYSLYLQFGFSISFDNGNQSKILCSIGNLNSHGLSL